MTRTQTAHPQDTAMPANRRRLAETHADRPNAPGAQAEDLLRELAFVLHLTRRVRESIDNADGSGPAPASPCVTVVGR